jgi:hypothetical protein
MIILACSFYQRFMVVTPARKKNRTYVESAGNTINEENRGVVLSSIDKAGNVISGIAAVQRQAFDRPLSQVKGEA